MTDPNIAKLPLRTLAAWACYVFEYTVAVPAPDTFIITRLPTHIHQEAVQALLAPSMTDTQYLDSVVGLEPLPIKQTQPAPDDSEPEPAEAHP